jgi:membrane associated rhomboid family serine protease
VGIYDRDYYQNRRSGPSFGGASFGGPQTVVGWLIVINVAVWLVDALFQNELCGRMAVHSSKYAAPFLSTTLTHPLYWWQFLTAGFAHSPQGIGHVLGNMLVLFFLGRDVEYLYGPKEFLRVYLATLVFANVAWAVANQVTGLPLGVPSVSVYGASGAIAGIVVLYALNFPNRTLLLYFIIPVPAWLLGAFVVAYDVYGAMIGVKGSNVAYSVHVAGAAFAMLYFFQRWNLSRLTDGLFGQLRSMLRRKPRLHVHRPDENQQDASGDELTREVDRILEKIGREGEASLTAAERRALEAASRRYREKMDRRS